MHMSAKAKSQAGRCRLHGGRSPGAPKGNQNARKHGFHSAGEIVRRRAIAALLRNMRALARAVPSGRRASRIGAPQGGDAIPRSGGSR
jgi:hypothetical protein